MLLSRRMTRIPEDAEDTLEGLERAVSKCREMVDLIIDRHKAEVLKARCMEILARF